MMAFSWFITKVPYQQGRQVRQCQLGPKKVTKPWFLGMKASTLAGLDQVFNCVNCVGLLWYDSGVHCALEWTSGTMAATSRHLGVWFGQCERWVEGQSLVS